MTVLPAVAHAQVGATCPLRESEFVNGSFETPRILSAPNGKPRYQLFDQRLVDGWRTDSPDGRIELWQDGFRGVRAAAGDQFAEIGATTVPTVLYQDFGTLPGSVQAYAFSHRGRNGTDTMELRIGPPGGPPDFTRRVSTGNDPWQQVLGSYPLGQYKTRFAFAWVSADQGNDTGVVGNLLDGVVISQAECTLTIKKALTPGTDPGRFDLLAGDQVLASAVGDGGSTGLVPMPLSVVRVSERAAAGNDPRMHYATSIICADSAIGELVAAAPDTQVMVPYTQPRGVTARSATCARRP